MQASYTCQKPATQWRHPSQKLATQCRHPTHTRNMPHNAGILCVTETCHTMQASYASQKPATQCRHPTHSRNLLHSAGILHIAETCYKIKTTTLQYCSVNPPSHSGPPPAFWAGVSWRRLGSRSWRKARSWWCHTECCKCSSCDTCSHPQQ